MDLKRITVFSGNYGSGKTNIAVNYASFLAKKKRTTIYDLDIVNPYFRTVDASKFLSDNNVELVVSPYAETNVDIPAMNASSYKMVDDLSTCAVVDLGGDDRGALALGRFRDKITAENNYDFLLVINKFRPETKTVKDVLSIKKEIEDSARIKFTGIVSNSNLGVETTEKEVIEGFEFCKEVSYKTGLKIKFTAVEGRLANSDKIKKIKNEILPLKLIKYGDWQ